MPRHEHEVRVWATSRAINNAVRLRCRCGWMSEPVNEPTVSRLAEIARGHRRGAA